MAFKLYRGRFIRVLNPPRAVLEIGNLKTSRVARLAMVAVVNHDRGLLQKPTWSPIVTARAKCLGEKLYPLRARESAKLPLAYRLSVAPHCEPWDGPYQSDY